MNRYISIKWSIVGLLFLLISSSCYPIIIAEETIDEKIVSALRKKVNIATEIMGEELKEWI